MPIHSDAHGTCHTQSATHHADVRCLQELLSLLQPDQPGGVHILSLHGMGGIGKTTMARELFNRLSNSSSSFNSRIFLEVGQEAPLLMQRQLLDTLAERPMRRAGSAAEQQQQLRGCFREAGRLLLVLDDIWTAPQRDALLCLDAAQRDGLLCPNALPEGSRIILTGRNSSNLLPNGGGCVSRPVEVLAPEAAKQLLCQHAFAADRVPPAFDAAVQRALEVCGGLPLALRAVGSNMLRSRTPVAAEVGLIRWGSRMCCSPFNHLMPPSAAAGAVSSGTVNVRRSMSTTCWHSAMPALGAMMRQGT